jgi:hypothetical protein
VRYTTVIALLSGFALALLLSVGSLLAGQEKGEEKKPKKASGGKGSSPYYPLTVGTTWQYRVGKQKATVRVVREETSDTGPVAVLETTLDGKKVSEQVGVRGDGVYRYSGEGTAYNPPICFLKLPPTAGATWEVKSRAAGLDVSGTFTAGEEEVTVGAGQYDAVTSTCPDFRIDGTRTSVTYWFVPGIGMVKQRLQIGKREVLIELEKYTPAK